MWPLWVGLRNARVRRISIQIDLFVIDLDPDQAVPKAHSHSR